MSARKLERTEAKAVVHHPLLCLHGSKVKADRGLLELTYFKFMHPEMQ